ncbi:MAG: hypothetical protein KAT74_06745 [Candidatus Cloacimonetes bacterium]|nr:hypothetical protein [Candidatus Cloacimonadota bacterium]
MKKILILIFISTLVYSCTRTITESCDDYSWQLHEDFVSTARVILNSYTTDQNELFIANQSELRKMNLSNHAIPCYHHIFTPYLLTSKPIISENYTFYLSPEKDKISICSNTEPYLFPIWYSDEFHDYLNVNDLSYELGDNPYVPVEHCNYLSDFCASNDENQMLTFIYDNNSLYFSLIDFHEDNDQIVIDNILTEAINCWIPHIKTIEYFNGYYFISLVQNFFKIDINGVLSLLPFISWHFFKFDSKLWAIAYENNENCRFYYTNDGNDWFPSLSISSRINLIEIDNYLIGYKNDNIFEIDLENLEVYYLDNSGLINSEITSINLFNDYIYVSSLNGLYYRDYLDFFEGKSTEPHDSNSMELTISGDE